MAKGYSGFVQNEADKVEVIEMMNGEIPITTEVGSSGGYGSSTSTFVDFHFRHYGTRDRTKHILISYLKNQSFTLDYIRIFLKQGTFDFSTDFNHTTKMVIGYSSYVTVSNLAEGDFYETWMSLSENTTYSLIAIGVSSIGTVCEYYNNSVELQNILSTPTTTVNAQNIDIASSSSGKRIVEFYRTDGYNPTNTSIDARNLFILTSVVNIENGYYGYYSLTNLLHRWETGNYTVSISYDSVVTNQSTWWSRIASGVSKVNGALLGKGIKFTLISSGTGDINVRIGDHYDLFGFVPSTSRWFNGTWETFLTGSYITSAEVKFRWDEVWHESWEGIVLEELMQCLGCGYDQVEYVADTIYSDFIYLNKPDTVTSLDQEVIDILYGPHVEVGMDSKDLGLAINADNGFTSLSSNGAVSMFNFEPGIEYDIRAFVIQSDGDYSRTSSWVSFTPTLTQDFTWTYSGAVNGVPVYGSTKNSNLEFYLSAAEWNEFIDYIYYAYEKRLDAVSVGLAALFLSWLNNETGGKYPIDRASSNADFTADLFNQVRVAICERDSGVNVPLCARGDSIYASYFNDLRDSIVDFGNNV